MTPILHKVPVTDYTSIKLTNQRQSIHTDTGTLGTTGVIMHIMITVYTVTGTLYKTGVIKHIMIIAYTQSLVLCIKPGSSNIL
jgi:hypothetical protein